MNGKFEIIGEKGNGLPVDCQLDPLEVLDVLVLSPVRKPKAGMNVTNPPLEEGGNERKGGAEGHGRLNHVNERMRLETRFGELCSVDSTGGWERSKDWTIQGGVC
jgi:hypothetical protein